MIKDIRNRNTFLWKLFLSYFLILVIPLLIMSGILYKTSVVDLQKEIEFSNMQKLTQIKDSLDMRMKELHYMVFKINNDVSLSPYSMISTGYSKIEGIKMLSIYKENNAFIEDVYVYYNGSDSLFSSNGQLSLSTFTKYVYPINEEMEKRFIGDINSVKVPVIKVYENALPDQSAGAEFITYLFPLSQSGGKTYGTVIVLIKRSVFENMIKDLLGEMTGSVFIMDENNFIIVSFDNKEPLNMNDKKSFIERYNSTGIYNLNENNREISLIKLISDETNWSFSTVMQTSQLFQRAIYMKTLLLQIVLSIFAFGMFVIIILTRKNYSPIGYIIKYINSQWSQQDKSEQINEIERIKKVIVAAIDQNNELKARMDSQKSIVKEQILTRLLKGEFNDYVALKKHLISSQITFPGPYYNVMLISNKKDKADSEESFLYREKLIYTLDHYSGEFQNINIVDLMYNNTIAMIINVENPDNAIEYQRILAQKIKSIIEVNIGGEIVIGVGKLCNDIRQLNQAYIEASIALEAKIIRSTDKIIFFEDVINREKQIFWYPTEASLRFIQSLKLGDRNLAKEALHVMMKDVSENQASIQMIRYVCFDIINMLVKTVNDLNILELNKDIKRLMEFSSLDNLETELCMITEKICNFVEEQKKIGDDELFDNIIDCINNRFDNFNLSLESISTELKLPVYYLSRFFKDHTGFTFTDYVSKLRFDKAKELLLKTDLPLKNIVAEIGYTDIPSFMRKFKKIEGITPGQYRKMYSEK